jgi:archaellum component FlaG (FlaF/FlaG flagellin family)
MRIIAVLVAAITVCQICLAQNTWIETTQEDFADGTFERNIYASHYDGGALEFAPRFDLNNDGFIDLFTTSRNGPDVRIYWGSASGYNASNVTVFPASGAGNCDAADVNIDGYADFLVTHRNENKLAIYWGTPAGPNPSFKTDIYINWGGGEACFIADCNKDGYLDIAHDHLTNGYSGVLWGSNTGYNFNNRTDLPISDGQHNIEIADYDKDNWLDIVFNDNGWNKIYWGSDSGYYPGNMTDIMTINNSSHGVSTGDCNQDHYLDLIFTHWYDPVAYIFWGDSTGYSATNMQILNPGYCYGGSTIANINADSYPDIVFFRGGYGEHQQVIYWGSVTGYSDSNRTWIGIPIEASGGCVADFDHDGDMDIFSNAITGGGYSYVFWAPSYSTYTALPTGTDHHGMFREIGNAYDRTYREDYLSSIYDAGEETAWGIIEWDDSLPPQSDVLMDVRTGNTPTPDSTWSGWDSVGNGENIPDSLMSQYIQYRAHLTYENPAYLPFLYEVRIELGPAVMILLEPDQADSTMPGQSISYPVDVINVNVGNDTIDLDYQHTMPWQIGFFDSTGMNPLIDNNGNGFIDVVVDSNDTVGIIVTVTPPDSAQGGEIDSLTVVGTSSVIPTENDSVHLITSIRERIAIILEPDQMAYTSPGMSVQYATRVINDGTRNDTIDLYYSHNQPWGVSLLDSSGSSPLTDHNGNGLPDVLVSSMDTAYITVEVFPPVSALQGEEDTLVLTGRSSLDQSVTDNAVLITIIETAGTIIVFPDQTSNGFPDSWVTFYLTCRNTQNFTDTIDLTLFDQQGWTYALLDSLGNPLIDNNGNGMVDLPGIGPSGGEVDFSTELFVPANTPSGTIDSILLFGYSGKDTLVRDSSILVINVGTYALIIMEPDQADSASYGSTIDYLLYVQNLGNYVDTIDIAVISGSFVYSLRDIHGNLLQDTNNNGMVDIGTLAPLAGESLMVRVQVTGTEPGYIDTAVVRAYSNVNSTVYDDARLYTRIAGSIWGLILEPDQSMQVEIGQTAVFNINALLEGSIADVVDLTNDQVSGDWTITLADSSGTPLTDTDSDGLIDLGMITPSLPRRFQVLVRSPAHFDLIGQVDSLASCAFYVHGRCSLLESITDSVHLALQLVPPFDVHNFRNPFRGQTQFIFSLPKDGRVVLEIYNRVGELVRRLINNQTYTFGIHYYPWDGCNTQGERLKPGTYIYILDFTALDGDNRVAKKKAVILE